MKVALHTSQVVFENLHIIANTGRKEEIKVQREHLLNLLMDHSNMEAKLKEAGINVERP